MTDLRSKRRDEIRIRGGAGVTEAAAIMAAVAQLIADEEAARSVPVSRPRQSRWVLAWRPRPVEAPLPSRDPTAAWGLGADVEDGSQP